MNKSLEEMTIEELFSLWTAAYEFQGIAPAEEVKEVLDACSEEFSKRMAAK